MYSGD
jgi:phospholipid-transporting ATPase